MRGNFRNQRPARGDRGNVRGNRGSSNGERVAQRQENRADFHNELMEILTDEQVGILKRSAIDRAENANDFRKLQHEAMLNEAGIEGEKRATVLALLNQHSSEMLAQHLEAIENSEMGIGNRADNFEKRTELHNQLKNILTVSEFESLQTTMGMRTTDRRSGNRGMKLRNR